MESSIHRVNAGVSGIKTPELPLLPEWVAGVERAVLSLNDREGTGIWEFKRTPVRDIPVPGAPEQDYDFTALKESDWVKVIVPGELEMQGLPLESNTEYYYRTRIHIPEDFGGKRCMLRFDGVYSYARVWANGRYLRSHVGGFTTWYCDITDYAVPGGDVRLVLGIADLEGDHPGLYNGYESRRLRDPSGASDYAHHNIGGILRDVSLIALPKTYVARLHTQVEFDGEFRDAGLQIGIQVNAASGLSQEVSAEYTLLDAEGKACLGQEVLFTGDGERRTDVSTLEVKSPRHWDAEHPYLYTLRIALKTGDETCAVYSERIGFREIWFAGKKGGERNKVYVNGQEVKLRGTCRHDVSLRFGRSTTPEEDWAEIRAYKDANINHVRTSHYPASRHFLEACDTLGMYVEEENAASFQGDNGYSVYCAPEDFTGEFTEMVERDRNHPSILIWSLANESGFDETKGFRMESDYIHCVDGSRPVIFSYPFTVRSFPRPYDILSMHYVDADAPMGLDNIPVLHDEYMHIPCYNLEELRRDPNVRNFWGRSIQRAWDRIFDTDGALGGDLWGGIDDIFYLLEGISEKWQSHSRGRAAGYGPWGSVLDVYRRLKPEAYLTKKAYTPVKLREREVVFQGGRMLLPVKNRFDHTNLNELILVCVSPDGREQREQIRENIPPHSAGILQPDCAPPERGESVRLQFYKGDSLIDEYLIAGGEVQEPSPQKEQKGRSAELRETAGEVIVTAGRAEFHFDKDTAQLTQGQYEGKNLLCGGPHLLLTGAELGEWKKTCVHAEQTGGSVEVTLAGTYTSGFEVWYTITIEPDGGFAVRYLIYNGQTDKTVKELGIRFDLAPGADRICWEREGQYSCYPEDHIGRCRGTAFRRNPKAAESVCGAVPEWSWKEDMWDDFLYGRDEKDSGTATRDFRALRENIRYFEVYLGESFVRAEDPNRQAAARVSVFTDGSGVERTALLIANRWTYPELGWGNDGKRPIFIQRGVYGGITMCFGAGSR